MFELFIIVNNQQGNNYNNTTKKKMKTKINKRHVHIMQSFNLDYEIHNQN